MRRKKKPVLFWLFFACNGMFIILFLTQWLFPMNSNMRLIEAQNRIRLNILTRQERYIDTIEYYMPIYDITSLIAHTKTIAHDNGLYVYGFEMTPLARDIFYEDIIIIIHGEMIFLSCNINNLHSFLSSLPSNIYIRRLIFEHGITIRLVIDFVIIQ